jgi:hypothetical protein
MGNMHTRGYEGTKKVVNVVVGNRRDVRGILPLCAEVPRARAAGVPGAWARPSRVNSLSSQVNSCVHIQSVLIECIGRLDPDPNLGGQKNMQKKKKGKKFHDFEVLDFLL